MKIIKSSKNKQIIKMSQKEWLSIGQQAGWVKSAQGRALPPTWEDETETPIAIITQHKEITGSEEPDEFGESELYSYNPNQDENDGSVVPEDEREVFNIHDAARYILSEGGVQPSSSGGFHEGIWYTTIDSNMDQMTGEYTQYSFHVKELTPGAEKAIYNEVRNLMRR